MRRMEVPMSGLDARPSGLSRRWRLLLLGVAALVALLLVGWQLAARQLQQQIVAALGPRASVEAVALGWGGVEITGLRIAAAPRSGWPAADELRAARVHVVADLLAALRGTVSVRSIAVEDGYIALLRTRDGRLRVLPSLLESHGPRQPRDAERSGMPAIRIGTVTLQRTEVAFHDASVRQPPHLLRLADIAARIGPLQLPVLDTPTDIALTALLQGAQSRAKGGRLSLDGEVTGATHDADLKLRLRGVDVVALQPYLGRDANIRRGGLDLDLAATVQRQRLHAPGHLVLTQLEFGGSGGGLGGLPRQALVAFASKNERIELDFTLEGRLDDPKFSLNENLATRIASAMADKLGLSVGGMVEGVGSVVKGLFGQ